MRRVLRKQYRKAVNRYIGVMDRVVREAVARELDLRMRDLEPWAPTGVVPGDGQPPLLAPLLTRPSSREWYQFFRAHGAMILPDKFTAAYLSRFEFAAQTIVDVGVADGTPELYEALPDARLILVDPLEEVRDIVGGQDRLKDRDVTFHVCAVGAEAGEAELQVSSGTISKSTLHSPTKVYGSDEFVTRRVPIRTLDEVIGPVGHPVGLKIDTEGHEVDVLRGATALLRETEFVIAEASIKTRFVGGYRFSDLVAVLAENDFELLDVLGLTPGSALFLDCLFVRKHSPLFKSRAT